MSRIAETLRHRFQLTQHRSQSFRNHVARLGVRTPTSPIRLLTGEHESLGARSTFVPVSTATPSHAARARLGVWPHEHDIAHLVLLDHQMVPSADDVAGWVSDASATGARAIRTGALFPVSVAAFIEAGFQIVDTLALLERPVPRPADERHRPTRRLPDGARLRRLRPSMLHEAATIDRRAFASAWSNDVSGLADIMAATPHHRSRSVHLDGRMVAFSISGRADRIGYIQRLAVDPSARRRGLAAALLDDAERWMCRRDVSRVMVNTASDNQAALTLYESMGFERQADQLQILQRELPPG